MGEETHLERFPLASLMVRNPGARAKSPHRELWVDAGRFWLVTIAPGERICKEEASRFGEKIRRFMEEQNCKLIAWDCLEKTEITPEEIIALAESDQLAVDTWDFSEVLTEESTESSPERELWFRISSMDWRNPDDYGRVLHALEPCLDAGEERFRGTWFYSNLESELVGSSSALLGILIAALLITMMLLLVYINLS